MCVCVCVLVYVTLLFPIGGLTENTKLFYESYSTLFTNTSCCPSVKATF